MKARVWRPLPGPRNRRRPLPLPAELPPVGDSLPPGRVLTFRKSRGLSLWNSPRTEKLSFGAPTGWLCPKFAPLPEDPTRPSREFLPGFRRFQVRPRGADRFFEN